MYRPTDSFKAVAVAIEQIIENSDDTKEIRGVEKEFLHTKQTLEKILQHQDALVPKKSLEEFLAIYNLYTQILIESNGSKKYSNLKEFEEKLELFKVKYKEFTSRQILEGIEYIRLWAKANILLLEGKVHFILAFQEKDEEKQLEMFYQGCISLLDITENCLSLFTERGRRLGKVMAETLINYKPFNDYSSLRPPGKFTSITVGIKNAARAIIWETNEYEKRIPKSFSIDWEEEAAFMDTLIENMEESRKAEYSKEEAEALEKALEKFFD